MHEGYRGKQCSLQAIPLWYEGIARAFIYHLSLFVPNSSLVSSKDLARRGTRVRETIPQPLLSSLRLVKWVGVHTSQEPWPRRMEIQHALTGQPVAPWRKPSSASRGGNYYSKKPSSGAVDHSLKARSNLDRLYTEAAELSQLNCVDLNSFLSGRDTVNNPGPRGLDYISSYGQVGFNTLLAEKEGIGPALIIPVCCSIAIFFFSLSMRIPSLTDFFVSSDCSFLFFLLSIFFSLTSIPSLILCLILRTSLSLSFFFLFVHYCQWHRPEVPPCLRTILLLSSSI